MNNNNKTNDTRNSAVGLTGLSGNRQSLNTNSKFVKGKGEDDEIDLDFDDQKIS